MSPQPPVHDEKPHTALVFWAVLGAAISWAVHIGARYPLVLAACSHDDARILHLVTALCALGIGLAALASLRLLRYRSSPGAEEDPPRHERIHFLGRVGMGLSVLFLLAIGGELLPTFFQDPCTPGRAHEERSS